MATRPEMVALQKVKRIDSVSLKQGLFFRMVNFIFLVFFKGIHGALLPSLSHNVQENILGERIMITNEVIKAASNGTSSSFTYVSRSIRY